MVARKFATWLPWDFLKLFTTLLQPSLMAARLLFAFLVRGLDMSGPGWMRSGEYPSGWIWRIAPCWKQKYWPGAFFAKVFIKPPRAPSRVTQRPRLASRPSVV